MRCSDLTVRVGDRAVLDTLDLVVAAGTTCAVLGPSGTGKTTLLRAIAGLAPTQRGTVHLGERDITTTPPGRRRIAMVFQDARLFPALSVLDSVAYALRAQGVRRQVRQAAAHDLLDAVGLGSRYRDRPGNLSGGERQRVALARALCAQPDLLLLDEPLSAVDSPARGRLRTLLRDLQVSRPTTTVTVTRDLADATSLGDTIAVLLDGQIAQCDAPTTVLDQPVSPAVADLTGNLNHWRVRVERGCADLGDWQVPVAGPDGDAVITFRPEQLRVHPDRGLRARVHHVEQRGTDLRVLGHGLAGPIEARLPPAGAEIRPGDEIRLVAQNGAWRFPSHDAMQADDDGSR